MNSAPDLDEQIAYYRAIADEYEDHSIDVPGKAELLAAIHTFRPTGDVLELACGPGRWTEHLATSARSLTAIDASPEMLRRAMGREATDSVRFIEADLFTWEPTRRYDAVFFGFWISHVPDERFEAFWAMVARCLNPGGQVFFADDHHRTEAELIEGEDSPVVERRLNDGTTYLAIKVPHQPAELETRLRRLGWDITVTGTPGPFYWGAGTLA